MSYTTSSLFFAFARFINSVNVTVTRVFEFFRCPFAKKLARAVAVCRCCCLSRDHKKTRATSRTMTARRNAPTTANAPTDMFPVWTRVRFSGLKSRSELNGRSGIVKRFHEEIGCMEVVPCRGGDSVVVKPSNLALAAKPKTIESRSSNNNNNDNTVFRTVAEPPRTSALRTSNSARTLAAKTKRARVAAPVKLSERRPAKAAKRNNVPVDNRLQVIESRWVSVRRSKWPGRPRTLTMDDDF